MNIVKLLVSRYLHILQFYLFIKITEFQQAGINNYTYIPIKITKSLRIFKLQTYCVVSDDVIN